MILGEASSGPTLNGIFSHVFKLQLPTRAEFVDGLAGLGPLQAAALFLAGAAFLIYGFKYFKAFVLADAAAIGALVGGYLGTFGKRGNLPLLLGMACAIVLAVVTWRAFQYVTGVLCALAGALLGYGVWYLIAASLDNAGMLRHAWAGAIIGALGVGLLTFVLFRPAVMIFTSLQGGVMIISGACSILIANDFIPSLRDHLVNNRLLLGVLIGVLAAAGFVVQFAAETTKIRKRRKDTEKPPV